MSQVQAQQSVFESRLFPTSEQPCRWTSGLCDEYARPAYHHAYTYASCDLSSPVQSLPYSWNNFATPTRYLTPSSCTSTLAFIISFFYSITSLSACSHTAIQLWDYHIYISETSHPVKNPSSLCGTPPKKADSENLIDTKTLNSFNVFNRYAR